MRNLRRKVNRPSLVWAVVAGMELLPIAAIAGQAQLPVAIPLGGHKPKPLAPFEVSLESIGSSLAALERLEVRCPSTGEGASCELELWIQSTEFWGGKGPAAAGQFKATVPYAWTQRRLLGLSEALSGISAVPRGTPMILRNPVKTVTLKWPKLIKSTKSPSTPWTEEQVTFASEEQAGTKAAHALEGIWAELRQLAGKSPLKALRLDCGADRASASIHCQVKNIGSQAFALPELILSRDVELRDSRSGAVLKTDLSGSGLSQRGKSLKPGEVQAFSIKTTGTATAAQVVLNLRSPTLDQVLASAPIQLSRGR